MLSSYWPSTTRIFEKKAFIKQPFWPKIPNCAHYTEILVEIDFEKIVTNSGQTALFIETRYAQLIIAELKVIKPGAATVQLAIGYIYHGAKPVYG